MFRQRTKTHLLRLLRMGVVQISLHETGVRVAWIDLAAGALSLSLVLGLSSLFLFTISPNDRPAQTGSPDLRLVKAPSLLLEDRPAVMFALHHEVSRKKPRKATCPAWIVRRTADRPAYHPRISQHRLTNLDDDAARIKLSRRLNHSRNRKHISDSLAFAQPNIDMSDQKYRQMPSATKKTSLRQLSNATKIKSSNI